MKSPQPIPSSLGRTVDLSVPSNRNIVIFSGIMMVVMVGYRLLTGLALGDVAINAIGAGAFTFLAWAIGRELDPDYNLTATIGAGLMAVALFILPLPYLLSTGMMLTILRVLSRSTGLAPNESDALALMIGAGVTVWLDAFWGMGLLVVLTFILEATVPPNPNSRRWVMAGVTLLITVIVSGLANVPIWQFAADTPVVMVVVAVSVAYGGLLLRPQTQIAAVGDMTGEPLQPQRVFAMQWLALVAGILLFVTAGTPGIIAVLPLWAAMIGLIIRQSIVRRKTS